MTLFEQIIAGEIPAKIIYENEHCVAFEDANPQAPTHLLIIPRKPIPRIARAEDSDCELLGQLLLTARDLAKQLSFSDEEQGYRLVINSGKDGGETVPHLHVHLLAGRQLQWPPG